MAIVGEVIPQRDLHAATVYPHFTHFHYKPAISFIPAVWQAALTIACPRIHYIASKYKQMLAVTRHGEFERKYL
jgi:hypothetical protein